MMDFKTEAILALAKATILEVSFMDFQPDEELGFDSNIILAIFWAARASGIIDSNLVCRCICHTTYYFATNLLLFWQDI
jgi:hypothetical protein